MRCRVTLYTCLFLAMAEAQRLTSENSTRVAQRKSATRKIVKGVGAKCGAFPWHVGVYKNNGTGFYVQICAGTLISPDLVISAAHCFHKDRYGRDEGAGDFVIAAGKYRRLYYWPEPHVQKSSVKSIEKPKEYIGLGGNYAADIALVRLETRLNITKAVRPVCIDWDNVHEGKQLQRGKIGRVMGWGITETREPSNDLRAIKLPFVPYDECSSAVPEDFQGFISPMDKFCAGYLNGSSICSGDSGGGLCFRLGKRWYLRGIVSAVPSGSDVDLPCNNDQYAAFTNVGPFLRWIRAAYDDVGAPKGCDVPEAPKYGSFDVSCQGECKVNAGSTVPISSILVHRCETNYTLKGNVASLCTPSGWNSLPTCIKTCEPLVSMNKDIVCKYEGKIVPCDSRMEPGTKAFLACENFYKISGTHNSTHDEMTCLVKGEWDRPTLQCVPECGRPPNYETRFSYDGDGSYIQYTDLPWDVVITLAEPGGHSSAISGTLIDSNLVVSAANPYFFSDGEGHQHNITRFSVATRYFNLNVSRKHVRQTVSVESINFIEVNNSTHIHGIALLRLVAPVKMTTWVGPVCMDWDNRLTAQQLRMGNIGKIATNFLEIDGSVRKRTSIDVAYIPREDCLSTVEEGDKSIVADGFFCADHVTDTRLSSSCRHPISGSGLALESDGVWYLRGVLSTCVRRRSSLNTSPGILYDYMLFKDVRNYLGTIRDAYDAS